MWSSRGSAQPTDPTTPSHGNLRWANWRANYGGETGGIMAHVGHTVPVPYTWLLTLGRTPPSTTPQVFSTRVPCQRLQAPLPHGHLRWGNCHVEDTVPISSTWPIPIPLGTYAEEPGMSRTYAGEPGMSSHPPCFGCMQSRERHTVGTPLHVVFTYSSNGIGHSHPAHWMLEQGGHLPSCNMLRQLGPQLFHAQMQMRGKNRGGFQWVTRSMQIATMCAITNELKSCFVTVWLTCACIPCIMVIKELVGTTCTVDLQLRFQQGTCLANKI